MKYELELKKVISEIKKTNAKKVCIQLPDGLKQYANKISDEITKKTKAKTYIWLGSCFGACDIPIYAEKTGAEMLIQWGHSKWI
jgi:2-(3-amino-3-carboxypropyl)histidine synthase